MGKIKNSLLRMAIFSIFGQKTLIQRAWYRTLLSKMALAGSNIGFCQKYRKPFLTKITYRKIVRKGIFHENLYFWHFWAKNWKNGPCAKVPFFRFCPFFLIKSKSIENTKKLSPQMIKVCQKKFHLSKEKMDFWPFLWFWQNHKNRQKSIFSFERWNFFATL